MASNVVNAETIRDAWATLLTTALVGAGKPVQAVYNYKKSNFDGASPVVVVTSAGEARGAASTTDWNSDIYIDTWIFVLYSDEASFNEDEAEDALNLIEKKIADTLIDNDTNNANWFNADFVERSTIVEEDIGGVTYRHERLALMFQARSNE